jgi:hypothetical protein
MNNVIVRSNTRLHKWGWGILLILSAFMFVQGVAGYFIIKSPGILDQFIGAQMSEVRQSYPTVADQVVRQADNFSILSAGFGLLAFVMAWEGLRHNARWAWNAYWIVIGTLAAIAFNTLVRDGKLDTLAFFYIVVAVVGQLLAHRGLRSPSDATS